MIEPIEISFMIAFNMYLLETINPMQGLKMQFGYSKIGLIK